MMICDYKFKQKKINCKPRTKLNHRRIQMEAHNRQCCAVRSKCGGQKSYSFVSLSLTNFSFIFQKNRERERVLNLEKVKGSPRNS